MALSKPVSVACLFSVLLFQPLALAQDMTEDCVGQPTLDWNDTFGFVEAPTPTSDDFAMSNCMPFNAPSCASGAGLDRVVCFMPTNDCEVLVQNSTGGFGASIHVFSGACVPDPDSCVASESNDSNAATITGIQLEAMTRYCVVAERCGDVNLSVTINQVNGTDCGPLGSQIIFADGFESGDTTSWSATSP